MKTKRKKNKILITLFVLLFLSIVVVSGMFIYDYVKKENEGEEKYLSLQLNGEKEITINYAEKYTDKGASATYKKQDLTNDIEQTNDVDLKKIGTYHYKYKIKYKKQEKEIIRTINIVDKEKPEIKLKGEKEITITEGDKYQELGATASDNYDKDLTDKIKIDNKNLDTKKVGTYKIIYSVKDSSNNDTSVERIIKVKSKPKEEKKEEKKTKEKGENKDTKKKVFKGVPVLNYHFFYEKKSEGCDESICLKMDKFREQLKYLKDNGYKTLTINEFVDWMYGKKDIPAKSVLITIDDGAHGTSKINGNHLIPALEKYKMHATLFLITGWWDIKNYESSYLDIQSHTHNLHFESKCGHRSKVNCIPYKELLDDLNKSIKVVGSKASFCFPFYDYSENSIKAVKEVGFKVAFVGGNRKATRNDNKYKIPRYPIYDYTTMEQFKNMIN